MPRGFGRWGCRFREGGFRVTGPRLLVIEVLAAAKRHLSAKEIYARAVERNPRVGAATIYRTLDLLVSMGLITRSDFDEGFYRYELTAPGDDTGHVHLVCTGCGRTVNLERNGELSTYLDGLSELLFGEGFELDVRRINFFGLCSSCRTRNEQ